MTDLHQALNRRPMTLRLLPVGMSFYLMRTGERYKLVSAGAERLGRLQVHRPSGQQRQRIRPTPFVQDQTYCESEASMNSDRELMQAVLEAMEDLNRTGDTQVFDMYAAPVLIPALRERLAQPEQEPCREWVGLTEEEAFACRGRDYFETYRAIEAKLREKNSAD